MSGNLNEQGGKDILLKVAAAAEAFTVANTGDLFTLTGHGLKAGDIVEIVTLTNGAPLAVGSRYWVIAAGLTANDFQVSTTKGGTALVITADGSGTMLLYKSVGGIRAKSMTLNAEAIDITNEDSNQWRTILDEAGINSVDLSGSGVFENGEVIKQIKADVLARKIRNCALIISRGGDYMVGCFKFTSLEVGGEYNAESSYSISMVSSGEISAVVV